MGRGVSVEALFEADLRFELQDVQALRKAIAHCAKVMDFTTRGDQEIAAVELERTRRRN